MTATSAITVPGEIMFEDFEIELEPERRGTLGSKPQPAEVSHTIGSVDFRKTSVSGTMTRIDYFDIQGVPICLLEFGLRFKSGVDEFKLEKCDIVCDVRNTSSSSTRQPRFRAMTPTMLFNQDPITVAFVRTISILPQVQAAGFGVGGVGWSSQTSYHEDDGWDFDGSITNGASEQSRCTYNATSSGVGRRGFSQYIGAGVFIEHAREPFTIDFQIVPQLCFVKNLRYLGRSKSRACRTFDPPSGTTGLLQSASRS